MIYMLSFTQHKLHVYTITWVWPELFPP